MSLLIQEATYYSVLNCCDNNSMLHHFTVFRNGKVDKKTYKQDKYLDCSTILNL